MDRYNPFTMLKEIERKRAKMKQLIQKEGYLSRNVIKASQDLDKLIFEYQKKHVPAEMFDKQ